MEEDRDFEIFADDLFKFLLPQRLGIGCYDCLVKRKPSEPDSYFHSYTEIPIFMLNYNLNCNYMKYFFPENAVEAQSIESISRYYSGYTEVLKSIDECHVFDKLLVLASVTVELSAYCYFRGNNLAINYAPILYFNAFKYYFKKDFFDSGGWNAWTYHVCEDVEFYKKLKGEKLSKKSNWSMKTTKRISVLGKTAILFSIKLNKFNARAVFSIFISELETKLSASKVECTMSIDCPEAKMCKDMADQIMLIFRLLISDEKDSSHEQLSEIIKNRTYVKHLLRYCIFIKLVCQLILTGIRKTNIHILQFVKLLLIDNLNVAVFCLYIMQNIHELVNKKMVSEQYFKINFDETSSGSDLPEANFDLSSCEEIISNIRGDPCVEEAREIFSLFLDKIAPKNKPCTPLVSEIYKILSNEDDVKILFESYTFILIMNARVHFPNHCDDAWILIVMKYILWLERNRSTQMASAIKDSYSNEASKSLVCPKVTQIKQNTVKPTVAENILSSLSFSHETVPKIIECSNESLEIIQSSVFSISSSESNETEVVGDNLNMKTTHTPDTCESSDQEKNSPTNENINLTEEVNLLLEELHLLAKYKS